MITQFFVLHYYILIVLLSLLFQIVIIEHKSIICPGYNAVLHIHTCIEEVQITVMAAKFFFFFFLHLVFVQKYCNGVNLSLQTLARVSALIYS